MNDIFIAHRGESFDAPENTLAAINLAWERGAKSVEIDIHLTRDQEIVVIHDYDTLRISGVKKIIKNTSLNELKKLDFGSHKNIRWQNERIPTLREVLQTVPEQGKLIIEIKSDRLILGRLRADLEQSGLKPKQIEVIAFKLKTLAIAKKMMPQYKMLWLLNLDYSWPYWIHITNKKRIINKVKKLKLEGVNVWAGKILNKEFIEEFKRSGLLVYTWTVNDPEKAKSLIENGIDGITSDRPNWISQQINKN